MEQEGAENVDSSTPIHESSPLINESQTPTPVNESQTPTPVNESQTPTTLDCAADETSSDVRLGTTRKLKSDVWNHFDRKKLDGMWKAICVYCKHKLNGGPKDGTSHLRNHFNRCCLRNTRDIKQMVIAKTACLAKDAELKSNIALKAFDPELSRKDLATMIILHEYPLAIVSHIGFKIFCTNLQPLFKVVSRNTVKSDILKIYRFEKTKLMNLLELNKSRIAITTGSTVLFSGLKYPTANLFFTEICEIKLGLYDWMTSTILEIRSMSCAMIEKFNKYWDDIQGILSIATVLDPRYKMKSFECYFPLIYGDDRVAYETQKVRGQLNKLVKEYQRKSTTKNKRKMSDVDDAMMPPPGLQQKKNRFDLFMERQDVVQNVKTEMDSYLEESVVPKSDKFDVLTWWKTNGGKFPILYKIARDIFSIPMSTVASESAFSTSGRVVNPHRSRLLPSTLEAIMCAQSWLWNQFQDTSKSEDDVYMYYWDDGDTSDMEGSSCASSMACD